VVNVVKSYARASLHDISAIDVNVTYPDGNNDPPNRVSVIITYSYIPYIKVPFAPTLRTKAAGRIVN
jgi:hypothetical protein